MLLNGYAANLTSPSSSPWGVDYLCNESNFTNVSGAAPLAPSNTIPTHANQSWDQIWRDELTGLLITNQLYDGVAPAKDWYQLNATCKDLDSLNGGSSGTGWRLLTQKELLQILIDGISKVSLSGGTLNSHFWSSTGVSEYTSSAWIVNLAYGATYGNTRSIGTNSALCVRKSTAFAIFVLKGMPRGIHQGSYFKKCVDCPKIILRNQFRNCQM